MIGIFINIGKKAWNLRVMAMAFPVQDAEFIIGIRDIHFVCTVAARAGSA